MQNNLFHEFVIYMRSFLFLVFKLISRAFTRPLAETQVSLLGHLQLPTYFRTLETFSLKVISSASHFEKRTRKSISSMEESSPVSDAITLFLATFVIIEHMWTHILGC